MSHGNIFDKNCGNLGHLWFLFPCLTPSLLSQTHPFSLSAGPLQGVTWGSRPSPSHPRILYSPTLFE